MGTKFNDYLANSKAAETPEDAAERQVFASAITLGLNSATLASSVGSPKFNYQN